MQKGEEEEMKICSSTKKADGEDVTSILDTYCHGDNNDNNNTNAFNSGQKPFCPQGCDIGSTEKRTVFPEKRNNTCPLVSAEKARPRKPDQGQNSKFQEGALDPMLTIQERDHTSHEKIGMNLSNTGPSTSTVEPRKKKQQQILDPEISEPFDILSVVVQDQSCAKHPSGNNGTPAMSSWLSQFENSNPQELPTQSTTTRSLPPPESQPGAYSAAPGTTTMDRVDDLSFSLVGAPVEAIPSSETIPAASENSADGTPAIRTPELAPPDNNSNNNEELLEATPVHENDRSSIRMEAQPMDQTKLDQKAVEEAKYRRWKRYGCGFVSVACLVLIVSLVVGLTNQNDFDAVVQDQTPSSSGNPGRSLPPMENLETLYDELPNRTKESLYDNNSPQYQAWEWLLDHPTFVATYPKWRKKQVFAMLTFYFSFEGPQWSERTRGGWLNRSSSECSWVLSNKEVVFLAKQTAISIGPNEGLEDYQLCNADGELQTLIVRHLFLPPDVTPSIPPEIELLTSLRIVGVFFSEINAKLSDLLIPELIQLPKLVLLNFHSSGVGGTIPKQIGMLTGLRHLMLGQTKLRGTLPVEVTNMTSLESIQFFRSPGLTGSLPTEIGLMTRLVQLGFGGCSLTGEIPSQVGALGHLIGINFWMNSLGGRIPTELGLLTSMIHLGIDHNNFGGPIPSEMGLMTSIQQFWLKDNALTGSIPSELGLMTNARSLVLGNTLHVEGMRNNFSGYFPTELWELSNLERLSLANLPNLNARIPTNMTMPNVTFFRLEGSPHLSGTVPKKLCFLGDMPAASREQPLATGQALEFDCSDLLCGCSCECQENNKTNQD